MCTPNCKYSALPPIVLIHGACAAGVIWKHNFQDLSKERKIYAIDLPGFGLSDRIEIGRDPREVEENWTKWIDQWRETMNIDKMVLVNGCRIYVIY